MLENCWQNYSLFACQIDKVSSKYQWTPMVSPVALILTSTMLLQLSYQLSHDWETNQIAVAELFAIVQRFIAIIHQDLITSNFSKLASIYLLESRFVLDIDRYHVHQMVPLFREVDALKHSGIRP